MEAVVSFDQLHDQLRTTGQCKIVFDSSEAERFTSCCRRLDRVAVLTQRGGVLGAIAGSLAMPFIFFANRRTVGASGRVAAAVDLYVVTRQELQSVTGERQVDDSVKVTFTGR